MNGSDLVTSSDGITPICVSSTSSNCCVEYFDSDSEIDSLADSVINERGSLAGPKLDSEYDSTKIDFNNHPIMAEINGFIPSLDTEVNVLGADSASYSLFDAERDDFVDTHGNDFEVNDMVGNYGCPDTTANSHKSYAKVEVVPELEVFPSYRRVPYYIGGYPIQLNAASWLSELQYENDMWLKSYLHKGILCGFDIVDDVTAIIPYDCSNYSSVYKGEQGKFVVKLISSELSEGKYIRVSERPTCIHSLGVVPKKESGFSSHYRL